MNRVNPERLGDSPPPALVGSERHTIFDEPPTSRTPQPPVARIATQPMSPPVNFFKAAELGRVQFCSTASVARGIVARSESASVAGGEQFV